MPSSNDTRGEVASSGSAVLAEHCFFCFQVILAQLNGEPEPHPLPFPDAGQEYPLFVTWNIYSTLFTSSPRLRGCIGTFEPYPLAEGLSEYASISAFKDRRFNPISAKEVARLECGVSLLTAFEECQDHLDWEVGVHGIYIHLPNPALAPAAGDDSASSSSGSSTPAPTAAAAAAAAAKRSASSSSAHILTATYLPDVIPDQGWSKVEAIDSAIRKAGWNGRITDATRRSLRVRRYRSEKMAKTYRDFVAWQQQQQQQRQA